MKPTRRGFFGILGGIGAAATGALKIEARPAPPVVEDLPPDRVILPDDGPGLWMNGKKFSYNEISLDMHREVAPIHELGQGRYSTPPLAMRPYGQATIIMPNQNLPIFHFRTCEEVNVVIPQGPRIPVTTKFDGVISRTEMRSEGTVTLTIEIIHPVTFHDPKWGPE